MFKDIRLCWLAGGQFLPLERWCVFFMYVLSLGSYLLKVFHFQQLMTSRFRNGHAFNPQINYYSSRARMNVPCALGRICRWRLIALVACVGRCEEIPFFFIRVVAVASCCLFKFSYPVRQKQGTPCDTLRAFDQ